MNNTNLPKGFLSVDEAVELIKSDTRQNPVVDMYWLISRINWVEVAHNFRIPKIRRLAPEEVYRTARGVVKEYESTGEVYVQVSTSFDKELLRKTIRDKYRELVGREYQERGVRATSTVADDAQGRDAVRPRANKPIAQEGQSIGDGQTVTTNGEGLSV